MNAHVSNVSFQLSGLLEYLPYQVVATLEYAHSFHVFEFLGLEQFYQSSLALVGVFKYFFEGNAVGRFVWNEFDQYVCLAQGQFHYPRYVFNGRFCCHCAVGHNLRYLVFAVFFYHVINHLLAAFVVEVGINIGHRLAVWI